MEASTSNKPDLEFIPHMYCGLDFYFHTFSKLYIHDVLNMEDYPGCSGVFAHKNHPIYKVDIAGCVVRVDERSKCFVYSVDDGTGVINCCCWKQDFSFSNMDEGDQDQNLPDILRKKRSQIKDHINKFAESGYQLVDFVNIRGKVKIFRNMKEVVASYHKRIEDPKFEVSRMAELPKLYQLYYDKPFILSEKMKIDISETDSQHTGPKSEKYYRKQLKLALMEVLQTSTQQEVTHHQMTSIPSVMELMTSFSDDFKDGSISWGTIMEETLMTLEDEGYLYKRPDMKMVYENLMVKSKLEHMIKTILEKECEKPKYMEKGCYLFHILDELHKTLQYSKVNINGLKTCLNRLESQSEIISTTHKHYMPCPD